ncbi:MAG: hypothetical protein SF052_00240 [Bacteroidia bacterium]|nr:hypothetical protein [Bacteroidia bacterium]
MNIFQKSLPSSAIWASAFILLMFTGCGPKPSSSTEDAETLTAEESVGDSMRSRGLSNARMAEFSLDRYFPALYNLIKKDPALVKQMSVLAEKVVKKEEITTEKDLLAVFTLRDTLLNSTLYNALEAVNGYADGSTDDGGLYEELSRLGIQITSAEGTFTGLAPASFLEDKLAELGSEALKAYIAFQVADANSMSGEYPFVNMEPYQQMIEAGEKLMKLEPNPYFVKIEDRFYQALENFTDVHKVVSPDNARQENNFSTLVGGVNAETYPYITETETLGKFAQKEKTSPYAKVAARIMENMSEMTEKPENIYVIVTEWVTDEDMARRRVFTHLRQGQDIPHHLQIRRGDGKDYYAIVYRFYEDSDKATAALEKIEKQFPQAQMIYASFQGGKLYQLGPSAD